MAVTTVFTPTFSSLGQNQRYSPKRVAISPSRTRWRAPTKSPPKRRQQTQSPNRQQTKRSVEMKKEKKVWKEGEYPGDNKIITPRRTLVKNVKKRIDDRTAAKAWTPTVTEILADVIQNKQWEDALEVN